MEWQGEVNYQGQRLYVNAYYKIGWDSSGTQEVAYVEDLRVEDEDGNLVEWDGGLLNIVEDRIDQEMEEYGLNDCDDVDTESCA